VNASWPSQGNLRRPFLIYRPFHVYGETAGMDREYRPTLCHWDRRHCASIVNELVMNLRLGEIECNMRYASFLLFRRPRRARFRSSLCASRPSRSWACRAHRVFRQPERPLRHCIPSHPGWPVAQATAECALATLARGYHKAVQRVIT